MKVRVIPKHNEFIDFENIKSWDIVQDFLVFRHITDRITYYNIREVEFFYVEPEQTS